MPRIPTRRTLAEHIVVLHEDVAGDFDSLDPKDRQRSEHGRSPEGRPQSERAGRADDDHPPASSSRH
jgi:hypothetical protein